MRVLNMTLGKIFFSAIFPSVSVFQCEASGRLRLRCPDGKVTRPDPCGLLHAYVATGV
jgi:hypothetical protein